MDTVEQTIAALQAQRDKELELSSEHGSQAEKWQAAAAHERQQAGEHERLADEAFARGDVSGWMTELGHANEHTAIEMSARGHAAEEESQSYLHAATQTHLAAAVHELETSERAVGDLKAGLDQEAATLLSATATDPSVNGGHGLGAAAVHHDDGFDGAAT